MHLALEMPLDSRTLQRLVPHPLRVRHHLGTKQVQGLTHLVLKVLHKMSLDQVIIRSPLDKNLRAKVYLDSSRPPRTVLVQQRRLPLVHKVPLRTASGSHKMFLEHQVIHRSVLLLPSQNQLKGLTLQQQRLAETSHPRDLTLVSNICILNSLNSSNFEC